MIENLDELRDMLKKVWGQKEISLAQLSRDIGIHNITMHRFLVGGKSIEWKNRHIVENYIKANQ